MCPTIVSRLSDGPAILLSPSQDRVFGQLPSQSLLDVHTDFHTYSGTFNSTFGASKSTQPAVPVQPKVSRKRSRDESVVDELLLADGSSPQEASGEAQPSLNMAGSIPSGLQNGLGPSIANPAGAVESQQGAAAVLDSQGISRKAQRLDASTSGFGQTSATGSHESASGSIVADLHRTSPPSPPAEPLVDEATRLLGISWQRVDTDPDMAPAVRGWTKYIDNQYSAHLHDSQMLMKSRALSAYLVAATPNSSSCTSFYLFNEDLTQGQLVASSWEACLHNLRYTPPVFEGNAVIVAAGRPEPTSNPFTSTSESGVPLLQQALSSHTHVAPCGMTAGMGLNQGVDMGMEIDS
ncbi:hypothetical protein N7539_001692 [Penicillium diatomitis]|uniref:Uncharacterized protein n=1 Tax=Penicillium diatomitis TaxID=2819901 RepID=A0A9W9XH91_9EURO|nr:uncharacterized protein N7539_001692 [Penicillium diatomitis]KAJ5492946.1 hypothetical protein N7539_001692 [Penicillium diatomitis]